MQKKNKQPEFALYKGDEFVMIGTRKELADHLNVKEDTITFLASPTYKKRVNPDNATVIIRLDD